MRTPGNRFDPKARLLHWLMAPLVLAMLFIGIGMVSTTSTAYTLLLAIHKPLGALLLVPVACRYIGQLPQLVIGIDPAFLFPGRHIIPFKPIVHSPWSIVHSRNS